ncbi:MAG: Hsp20/alpha crystallin family protein [Proteobacteria bacterium]|nr:Hsp20/alpha crystallin family protein [Pseudomonadota bacterium]
MAESKEIKAKDKKEIATPGEQIKPGPIFAPEVDIFENEHEIVMLADLPGVKTSDLNIDLRDDTLTIMGDVNAAKPQNEDDIVVEYEVGHYLRQFTLSEVIDQSRIEAKLEDGVLRLTLPKVEKATPRKITVNA